MLPEFFKKIIFYFKKFPGIGEKSAERMAQFLVDKFSVAELNELSKNINKITTNLKHCQNCNIITDADICQNCANPHLEKKVMVVENSLDVFQMLKTNIYSGYYYVLGNLINFQKGQDASSLNINSLLNSIKQYKEVIIATNATLEGEITASYLKEVLLKNNPKLIITRLAYGLPSGSELKYADSETLRQAIINRIKF